jgi:hypothetical protein
MHIRHLSVALTWVAFLLLPVRMSHAITFAQLALGGGYEAVILVTNKTNMDWQGKIWISQGYNQQWQGPLFVNGQDFTGFDGATLLMDPHETIKIRITGGNTTRSGYLEIDSDSNFVEYLAVSYFYEFRVGGNLLDTTGSPESSHGTRFIVAVEKSSNIDTGIAWCPSSRSSSSPFLIILTLYDKFGNVARTKPVTFNGHEAQFLSEIFPDLPSDFVGQLKVEPLADMYLEVLRVEYTSSGFQLTSTPADSYIP